MVVIASPPKSDSCGLISSRLLLQTFTLLLLCNYHHGKKSFGEKELYPTTPWQLVRKSKYFPKKIPTSTSAWRMLWWTADPLNKPGRMDMGVALRFPNWPVSQSTPGVGGARIEFHTDSQRSDALTTNYP